MKTKRKTRRNQSIAKPHYEIPLMRDIQNYKHNGYHVVSTFSGAGGSCLGYRMAGYKVLWANEFVKAAQDVYKLNHDISTLDTRDIREVTGHDILKATGMGVGQIDILDGSPPCAAFSTSGTRDKGWGDVKQYSDKSQRVDDLFFEYVRLLKVLQPKVFIAENVKGLVSGKAKGYFKMILSALKDADYNVKAKVLDAQWLGVPQRRQRLIFIGVRNDIGLDPVFPEPKPYRYNTGEILPHIKKVKHGGAPNNWKNAMLHVHPTITQTIPSPTGYLSGGVYVQADDSDNGMFGVFGERILTIEELKKLFSFPDDFKLIGEFEKQWERLGRSVPPFMMREISKSVQEHILDKIES